MQSTRFAFLRCRRLYASALVAALTLRERYATNRQAKSSVSQPALLLSEMPRLSMNEDQLVFRRSLTDVQAILGILAKQAQLSTLAESDSSDVESISLFAPSFPANDQETLH